MTSENEILQSNCKEILEELRESEERFRLAVSSTSDLVYQWNLSDNSMQWFGDIDELMGYKKGHFPRTIEGWKSHILPEDREKVILTAKEGLYKNKKRWSGTYRVVRKDGSIIYLHGTGTGVYTEGKPVTVIGAICDITARKKNEERLKQLYQEKKLLLDNIEVQMWYLKDIETYGLVNKAHASFFGVEINQLENKPLWEIMSTKEEAQICIEGNKRVFREKKRIKTEEWVRDSRGNIRLLAITKSPKLNDEGNVEFVVCSAVDITDQRRAEKALRESERHYRQIVELLPISIFVHSKEEILFANTAAANLVNAANRKELKRKSILDFLHPGYWETLDNLMKEIIEKRDTKKIMIARLLLPTGMVIDVELVLTNFLYHKVKAVQIVAYDLTRRRKMEEEIFKADKLESIGILAGGIAHDFNNYLATLLGNICLAMSYKNDYSKVYNKLENMKKATLRAKDLSHQLFVFAKGAKPVKKVTSIEDLLMESTKFTLSGTSVSCQLSIAEDLYSAEVDEGQITQVIHNIIINAVHAMDEGGTIQVKAENVIIDEDSDEALVNLQQGNYIKMSIEDNGPGIPSPYLKKIFDPFFSTKIQGSGLGLATSYSIITNHDGRIVVETVEGKGTAFHIYLPAAREIAVKNNRSEAVYYGSGRILVVDDDEEVRETIGEMLRYLNYKVDFARDGSQALDKYIKAKKTLQPFDLVVMDLTIPGGMGGKQTIKKLVEVDPSVKAVVASGYFEDPVMSSFEEYGFKGVIKKPFKIEELSEVIYETILEF